MTDDGYNEVPSTSELPIADNYSENGGWTITCKFCPQKFHDQFMQIALYKFKEHAIQEHWFPGTGLYMNPKVFAERQVEREKYREVMGSSDIAHQMNKEGL